MMTLNAFEYVCHVFPELKEMKAVPRPLAVNVGTTPDSAYVVVVEFPLISCIDPLKASI